MDSFGRGLAIILSVVLLFILPMQYLYDSYYHKEYTQVTSKTIAFTEKIRSEGYLSLSMYEEFAMNIGNHGSLYNIEIEIAKPHIGSAARINNIQTVSNTRDAINYKNFIKTLKSNKQNLAVMGLVKKNIKVCNYGHTYELDDNDVDHGCNICSEKVYKISATPNLVHVLKGNRLEDSVRVIATYYNEKTEEINGWTSDFDSNQMGVQYVTISYQGISIMVEVNVSANLVCSVCGNSYDPLPDGTDGGCPVCTTTIVSLRATPSSQTILKDTPMVLTVFATYKDGTSKEIKDYTTNFNSSIVGEQSVTIYYDGISTAVKVTVTDDLITCGICGHTYSWKLNPLGCPNCSKTIVRIEAYVKGGGNQVVYGSELSLDIILIYKDGHRELAIEGYTYSGYEPYQLGEQRVRVLYQSFNCTLDIQVINNMKKVTCNIGHVYYLNEDGSDPGCNICLSGHDKNQQGMSYEIVLITSEILEELQNNGKITLDKGDYITIRVIPHKVERKNRFYSIYNLENDMKTIIYGGRI